MSTPSPTPARTALVTGAASGIGRATARVLAERGWRIALWDLAQDPLDELALELGSAAVAAVASVDVTDEQAVPEAAAAAAASLDGIGVLIHCAGILHVGEFVRLEASAHRRMIDVNLWGTANVVHSCLPHLLESRGAVMMMGSVSAFYGPPEYASYGATKAGVVALGEALRIELEEHGIAVATCNPLFVAGPMVANQQVQSRYVRHEGIAHTPEQIAQTIARWAERPRSGLLWPSFAPRRIYILSRYLAFAAHRVLARIWHNAGD